MGGLVMMRQHEGDDVMAALGAANPFPGGTAPSRPLPPPANIISGMRALKVGLLPRSTTPRHACSTFILPPLKFALQSVK